MNALLAHRGPDADGIWTHGPCTLGHRRLAILDLRPEGRQPLLNEDGSIAVVVNGEIYNWRELRRDLEARGHTFRSNSDSEVVVHLYEEHGDAAIARLDGMFAIALYDTNQERLLLARDRVGKKPLFVRALPSGGLAFASELHALVRAFPDLPATPNLEAIDEYLTLQYVPSPETAFQGITKLPPAHLGVIEPGAELQTRRYWAVPQAAPFIASDDELARELRAHLERAVSRRLMSDVPLGAFLSGGIDSSVIVALMAQGSSRPVETFSIGFPDASDTELPYARLVADRYRTHHHEAIVTPDVASILEASVEHHGEPFADSSAIATYCLARETKKYVTVALSGDGSDEAFAGYTRYVTAQLGHAYDAAPTSARPHLRRVAAAIARHVAPHVAGYFEHLGDGEAARYPYIMCQFTPEEKRDLYLGPMLNAMTGRTTARFEGILAAHDGYALGRLTALDRETYLPDDINAKVDIAAMAHGLEVRCPFEDTAILEFAARLPRRSLMRLRGKQILRRAVGELLPGPIRRRTKKGFGLPLRRWMKRDLDPLVRDVLLGKKAQERGLFEPTEVRRLVASLGTDRNAPDRVWTLLVLEMWFRRFVDA